MEFKCFCVISPVCFSDSHIAVSLLFPVISFLFHPTLQKEHIFPNIMRGKKICFSSLSLLCCVQFWTDTLTSVTFHCTFKWVFFSMTPRFPLLVFEPEHLPQPAAVAVERSLRNITNWVSSSVWSSQELYRAFPSSSTPLTNPCSSIYPTLMSLSTAVLSISRLYVILS